MKLTLPTQTTNHMLPDVGLGQSCGPQVRSFLRALYHYRTTACQSNALSRRQQVAVARPRHTPLLILLPLEFMPEGAHILAHRAAGTCRGGNQRTINRRTRTPCSWHPPPIAIGGGLARGGARGAGGADRAMVRRRGGGGGVGEADPRTAARLYACYTTAMPCLLWLYVLRFTHYGAPLRGCTRVPSASSRSRKPSSSSSRARVT